MAPLADDKGPLNLTKIIETELEEIDARCHGFPSAAPAVPDYALQPVGVPPRLKDADETP
jgi:hypothetical protein